MIIITNLVLLVAFGVALLGLLGFGICYAFYYATEGLLANLDSQLAAIITIATAALRMQAAYASALRNSQKNTQAINIKKRLAYERFIQIWRRMFWQNLHQ